MIHLLLLASVFAWEEKVNSGSMNGYFTIDELRTLLQEVSANFTIVTNGQIDGRDVYYSKISMSSSTQKEKLLILAGVYGGYPLGTSMAVYSLLKLANESQTYQEIVMMNDVYVIPLLNSYAYTESYTNWTSSKTIYPYYLNSDCQSDSGVNLNRNWNFEWNLTQPEKCGDYYPGSSANSESLTKWLDEFMKNEGITHLIHYERNGNKYLKPYSSNSNSINDSVSTEFYEKISSELSSSWKFGTAKELHGEFEHGTLLDYAFSKGTKSLEAGIGPEGTASESEIPGIVSAHFAIVESVMQKSNFYLELAEKEKGESVCSSCQTENAYSVLSLTFELENKGSKDKLSTFQFSFEHPANSSYSFELPKAVLSYNSSEQTINSTKSDTSISLSTDVNLTGFSKATVTLKIERVNPGEPLESIDVSYSSSLFPKDLSSEAVFKKSKEGTFKVSPSVATEDTTDTGDQETTQETEETEEHSLNSEVTVGIIVGTILLVLGIVALVVYIFIVKRKKNQGSAKKSDLPAENKASQRV